MRASHAEDLNGSRRVARSDRPTHELALVVWRDAWFDMDLASQEDARADYLVLTVGFLISRGPTVISLAQEVLPHGEGFRAVTHIPVTVVERVTSLQPGGVVTT